MLTKYYDEEILALNCHLLGYFKGARKLYEVGEWNLDKVLADSKFNPRPLVYIVSKHSYISIYILFTGPNRKQDLGSVKSKSLNLVGKPRQIFKYNRKTWREL